MKNLSLLILLSLSIFIDIKAQKTIEFDKQWNVVDYKVFTSNTCTNLYSFRKDTTINSQEYLELYSKSDTTIQTNWSSLEIFMREDSLNRIYVLENGIDKILYDFNLVQNDTFHLNIDFFDCELIVYQVDSVQFVNGESRKRIRLIRSDDPNPDQPWYGYKDWIQGIGSSTSLYRYVESCFTDYPLDLLCYFENEELVYSNPNNQGCYITPVEEIPNETQILIYPNPTINELNIISNYTILNTKIIGFDGRLMLDENNKSRLNLSDLISGFYIAQIETSNGVTIKKVLVR